MEPLSLSEQLHTASDIQEKWRSRARDLLEKAQFYLDPFSRAAAYREAQIYMAFANSLYPLPERIGQRY